MAFQWRHTAYMMVAPLPSAVIIPFTDFGMLDKKHLPLAPVTISTAPPAGGHPSTHDWDPFTPNHRLRIFVVIVLSFRKYTKCVFWFLCSFTVFVFLVLLQQVQVGCIKHLSPYLRPLYLSSSWLLFSSLPIVSLRPDSLTLVCSYSGLRPLKWPT